MPLLPPLARTVATRLAEFDRIEPPRREQHAALARWIAAARAEPTAIARLNFICTHNSRRSHLAQLWAQAAAAHYNIDRLRAYSGGTEATACNPRAIAALQRAGFDITTLTPEDDNPIHLVRYSDHHPPIACFSKAYNHPPNPSANYAAIMVCNTADEACPIVRGCAARFAIQYHDPKAADNTPEEHTTYDQRSNQIAREMLYTMSLITSPMA